jgi:pimeloyl-ACP methyl ester carboxylesterase
MPVSFRITHPALPREELCAEITQIIQSHIPFPQKFVLASHSYGTVITTHLLNHAPLVPQIGPIVLIDPVSILLHLPDVAFNFTRRQPKEANEFQLYYFASMDMGVAHTLARHFFWNENVVWKKDLVGHNVTVSLGGRDLIVNTEAVGRYLSSSSSPPHTRTSGASRTDTLIELEETENSHPGLRLRGGEGRISHDTDEDRDTGDSEEEWKGRAWRGEGIDLLWFKELDHAQVFDKPATRKRLIDCILAYCDYK